MPIGYKTYQVISKDENRMMEKYEQEIVSSENFKEPISSMESLWLPDTFDEYTSMQIDFVMSLLQVSMR